MYYVLLFLLGWLASSEFEHGWKHDVRTQHKTKFVFRRCNVELSRNVTESRHFDSISLRRSYASGEKQLPKQTTTRKLLTTRSADERQIPTADSSKTQDLTSKLFRLISSCVLFCLYLGGMSLQFKDLSTGSFRCTSCTLAKCLLSRLFFGGPERISPRSQICLVNQHYRASPAGFFAATPK